MLASSLLVVDCTEVNMLPVGQDKCQQTAGLHSTHPVFVPETQFTTLTVMEPPFCIEVLFFYLKQQVLGLVTPKPAEVIRASALRFPDLNRSLDFLPREAK